MADAKTKKGRVGELGQTGVQFFSGMISGEEYNSDLVGQKGRNIYDRMRKSDAQVHGTLLALKLPILAADWFVEPASDKPVDVEIAETIQENLLTGMTITWADFLRQALTYFDMGFMPFELVWEVRDGKYYLRKLAPRLQKTLYAWKVDKHGGLEGMEQFTQEPNNGWETIFIPVEKLLLFVNEQEGSNFEGVSILRSAYPHWWYKSNFYQIDAIAQDRFASGTPVVTAPAKWDDGDRENVRIALEYMYSREKSYMILPNGWTIEMFQAGSGGNIFDSIRHHDQKIPISVIANFMNLGTSESGSRSLGDSFEELFLMSINSYADYVAEQMTRHVIKKYVDYNYTVEEYPEMRHSRIILNVGRLMETIGGTVKDGVIKSDLELENGVRKVLGFMEREEEEVEEVVPPVVKTPEEVAAEAAAAQAALVVAPGDKETDKTKEEGVKASEKKLREYRRRNRTLTEIEKRCADMDECEFQFNEGTERVARAIRKVREMQVRAIAKTAAKGNKTALKVTKVDTMAARIYEEMNKSFKRGTKQVEAELKKQDLTGNLTPQKRVEPEQPITLQDEINPYIDFGSPASLRKFMRMLSKQSATEMANALETTALSTVGALKAVGVAPEVLEQEIFNSVSDIGIRQIDTVAEGMSSWAFNAGRRLAGEENKEVIESAVRSVVLDGNACEVCLPKDQVEHEVGDPEFMAPDPACLGRFKCRCINIYKLVGMEGDFETKSTDQYNADVAAMQNGDLSVSELRARYE